MSKRYRSGGLAALSNCERCIAECCDPHPSNFIVIHPAAWPCDAAWPLSPDSSVIFPKESLVRGGLQLLVRVAAQQVVHSYVQALGDSRQFLAEGRGGSLFSVPTGTI